MTDQIRCIPISRIDEGRRQMTDGRWMSPGPALDPATAGTELYDRIRTLYRSPAVSRQRRRETLRLLAAEIDIQCSEVPTGTRVFDWTVPKEWNIRDAYIQTLAVERVVDFKRSNLHVLNYSIPIRARLSRSELEQHLFSIPEHPDWIPYKTSYYSPNWGFCVTDRQLQSLRDDQYDVCIDSSLEDGHLTYGECVLRGRETREVLFSAHVCHPSLCNDNLSGISVAVSLAKLLRRMSHRYTYRFLFIPGTIGAITWLARNEARARAIGHGLVLACLGDDGHSTYKRSRRGSADIDRAIAHVLEHSGQKFEIEDFSPRIRRASILFARLQPARRGDVQDTTWPVSGIPHPPITSTSFVLQRWRIRSPGPRCSRGGG
jgi:aminopeptidase-like protein